MPSFHHSQRFSTYSIVARDPESGALGIAVQTHQMGVGRLVPWLEPGVGAIATQSLVNISFGPSGLALLRAGVPAPQVIAGLVASDPGESRRQVAVVDMQGRAAAHTGGGCIREAGHHAGEGYSVQANMMTNPTVITAMRHAYESATGDLAERMLAALQAAQAEDGDIRGMQSAALKVVPGTAAHSWETIYDLRVDEHAEPVVELARLVRLRRAQLIDQDGYRLLAEGDLDAALRTYQQARALAPELEELAFWQGVTLADRDAGLVGQGADIIAQALASDARRAQWLDLIARLHDCGLIEREGAAAALLTALKG